MTFKKALLELSGLLLPNRAILCLPTPLPLNLGNNNLHLLAYLRSTFKSTYYFGLNDEATNLVRRYDLNVGCVIPTLPKSLDVFNFRPDVVFVDLYTGL